MITSPLFFTGQDMSSVQLTCFELPSSALGIKLSKREEEVDFFVRYMRRDLFQVRINVESLFGTHIPPLLGGILLYCPYPYRKWAVSDFLRDHQPWNHRLVETLLLLPSKRWKTGGWVDSNYQSIEGQNQERLQGEQKTPWSLRMSTFRAILPMISSNRLRVKSGGFLK